jgi:hypothetical protein
MLKDMVVWSICGLGIMGGIGIAHLSANWMAAFFGVALSGLSFFIGMVMGILQERENRKSKESTGEFTELEEQQRALINSLLAQRKMMADASEVIAKGVGSSVAIKMIDEMFANKDNREQVDSVLTRAQEIVDEEVEDAYKSIK